jgi:hypothetical protein
MDLDIKNMKKILYLIFSFLLISCDDTSKSEISKKIYKECVTENCEINMGKIVSEDWDYVFIFKTNTSLEEINNELGFDYPYFEDIATRVVFVKNNKVVYHEDEFPNPYKVKKGEVIFDIGDKNSIKISRHKAIFLVHKTNDFLKLKLNNK